MKEKIIVVGHKNPDTDAICSAIGYAYYKNKIDKKHLYIPMRAGELNPETIFALERFSVEVPELLDTLIPRMLDLPSKEVIVVGENTSIGEAAKLLRKNDIRTLPVVDSKNNLKGIVTSFDITHIYSERLQTGNSGTITMEFALVVKNLQGTLYTNLGERKHISGRIMVADMTEERALEVIATEDIVIMGNRIDLARKLIKRGITGLIFTANINPPQDVVRLAEEKGVLLLSTPLNTFETVKALLNSVSVATFLRTNAPVVSLYNTLDEVKKIILNSPMRCALLLDDSGKLLNIVTRTDLLKLMKKRVILVDHNETSQAVDGIEFAEIIEVVDHHHVGDISTYKPIYFHNEPVGSTSTIVGEMILSRGMALDSSIAGILLSGILSDTLNLTLSTTTEKDRKVAEKLAEIAGVDQQSYGMELLKSGTSLDGLSIDRILMRDFKQYKFGDVKIGLSQIFIFSFDEIKKRESHLKKRMSEMLKEGNFYLLAFLATNPIEKQSFLITVGNTEVIERVFDVKLKDGKTILKNIMSRKKDFVPLLGEELLRQMGSQ